MHNQVCDLFSCLWTNESDVNDAGQNLQLQQNNDDQETLIGEDAPIHRSQDLICSCQVLVCISQSIPCPAKQCQCER
jgi:hypothetical protein